MDVVQIKNPTRTFGKPRTWNEKTQGPCGALPVIDVQENGTNFMVSFWRPRPEEIELLKDGGVIQLHVQGYGHPVVAMAVSRSPEETP